MPLRFHRDAFEGIPQQDMQRLMAKIEWPWTNRLSVNHFSLSGDLSGFYKRRLGKYRIIYTYEPNPDDMVIRLVGLREDIHNRPVKHCTGTRIMNKANSKRLVCLDPLNPLSQCCHALPLTG